VNCSTYPYPMDVSARLNVALVACQHAPDCTVHMRRSLLTGLYELADSCKEYLVETGAKSQYQKAWNELEVMKLIAERALQNEDFGDDVFRRIADASLRTDSLPKDTE